MLVETPYLRNYLFAALEAGPDLFTSQLQGLTGEEADRRPDPERFTIREVMAHLADWEDIFLGRMRRIQSEDHPTIPGYDEGDRAIERNYAATDPHEQLRLFAERRAQTIAFLQSLQPEEWKRTAERPEIGTITLETQAALLPLHDLYHLRQVDAWRKAP